MSPLIPPLTGTSHLKPTSQNPLQREDPQKLKFPSPEMKVQQRRPKVYRIVLHSDDRVAGTPTAATFDLGDLKGAWGLGNDNLDAGKVHYLCKLETFTMHSVVATRVTVHGEGLAMQRETYDSAGRSDLLGIASNVVSPGVQTDIANSPFTMTQLPGGRVTILIRARRLRNGAGWIDVQSGLDTDADLQWQLVLSITPQEVA